MTYSPPDVDPYEDDDKPEPSEWEGGKPTDSNGREYNPYAGSQTPSDGRCNACLTNWSERYGERRYCSRLPEKAFVEGGSDFCRTHKSREALMSQAQDLFKHGAFSKNYQVLFKRLSPWEQIEAVQTFSSLLKDSSYEFDAETVDWEFDVSETEAPFDTFEEEIPIPQAKTWAAKSLWFAALDQSKMARIQVIQFKGGMEVEKTVAYTEDGQELTELDEHHLHLTYGRLVTNWEKNLKAGGIDLSSDDGGATVEVNGAQEFVVDVDDLAPSQPEAGVDEEFPLHDFEDE